MKIFQIAAIAMLLLATSCATKYNLVDPKSVNFVSVYENENIKLEHKYDVLEKKYAKKEVKKGLKVVAVKITNNSDKDVVFGRDIHLSYGQNEKIQVVENKKVFNTLKQSVPTYLLYMLLTPMQFTTTTSTNNGFQNNVNTNSTPIGLVVGPGITATNMLIASGANKKFKEELTTYDLNGVTIKKGETKYGLVGIKTKSYDALKIEIE